MKAFSRIFAAALTVAAGLIAYWLSLFALLSFSLYYFGSIQAIFAVIFATSLIITALIHWSEQKSFPLRW
jgi:hypothetical protein